MLHVRRASCDHVTVLLVFPFSSGVTVYAVPESDCAICFIRGAQPFMAAIDRHSHDTVV